MRTRARGHHALLALALVLGAGAAHADPFFVDATSTSFPPQPCGPGANTGCYTNFLVLADVTGDAVPDVFFANGGDYYVAGKAEPSVVYQGKGAGIFEDVSQSWLAGASSRLRQVAIADVDGDGLLDVYQPGGYGMDPDKLFVQGPAGTFTDRASTLLPAALASRAGAAHFGDVDNDGDLDLVVTDWGDNPSSWMGKSPLPALLHLYLNDGKGHFTAAPDTAIPAGPDGKTGNTPIDVDFVDVNGDLALDIVLDNRNGLSRLLINDGKGTFVDAPFPPKKGPYSYNIEACDIDADGDLDLLIDNAAAQTGHSTQVLINDGMGTFSDESARITGEPKSDDNIVKCADVDGDGAYDLVVGSLSWTSEKLLRNDGTGHFVFVADAIPKITDPTLGLDVADVDGDGLLDFVTGQGESTPRLNRVYKGAGASQPDTHPPVLRKIEVPTAMAGMPIPMRVAVSDSHTSEVGQQVREVVLTYTIKDKPQKVNAAFMGGDIFRGVIPPQPGGTMLTIVVSSKDAAGNVAKSDPIDVMVSGMGGVGGSGGAGGDSAAAGAAGASAGAAGTGDAVGGASAGTGAAGAGGSVGGAPATPPASSDSSSGCGCSIPAASSVGPWGLLALLGLAGLRRRRRLQPSLEERDQLGALLGRDLERRQIGVGVGNGEPEAGPSALRVEVDHLAEGAERAVVEIRRGLRDVPQRRHLEEPLVGLEARHREATRIAVEHGEPRLLRDPDARQLGA
jgi:MYXO-CTERM domain-containing protein